MATDVKTNKKNSLNKPLRVWGARTPGTGGWDSPSKKSTSKSDVKEIARETGRLKAESRLKSYTDPLKKKPPQR